MEQDQLSNFLQSILIKTPSLNVLINQSEDTIQQFLLKGFPRNIIVFILTIVNNDKILLHSLLNLYYKNKNIELLIKLNDEENSSSSSSSSESDDDTDIDDKKYLRNYDKSCLTKELELILNNYNKKNTVDYNYIDEDLSNSEISSNMSDIANIEDIYSECDE